MGMNSVVVAFVGIGFGDKKSSDSSVADPKAKDKTSDLGVQV